MKNIRLNVNEHNTLSAFKNLLFSKLLIFCEPCFSKSYHSHPIISRVTLSKAPGYAEDRLEDKKFPWDNLGTKYANCIHKQTENMTEKKCSSKT